MNLYFYLLKRDRCSCLLRSRFGTVFMIKTVNIRSSEGPLFCQGRFRNGPKTRSKIEAFLRFSSEGLNGQNLVFPKENHMFLEGGRSKCNIKRDPKRESKSTHFLHRNFEEKTMKNDPFQNSSFRKGDPK